MSVCIIEFTRERKSKINRECEVDRETRVSHTPQLVNDSNTRLLCDGNELLLTNFSELVEPIIS